MIVISRPILIKFGTICFARTKQVLSTTQPEIIYAHARNLTSGFY